MCGLYVFLSARVRSFLDERGVTTAEYALAYPGQQWVWCLGG